MAACNSIGCSKGFSNKIFVTAEVEEEETIDSPYDSQIDASSGKRNCDSASTPTLFGITTTSTEIGYKALVIEVDE